MKTTIEVEEIGGKLHVAVSEKGVRYTAKERRLVGLLCKAFPKTAEVSFSRPGLRNCDRFGDQDEAIAAFTEEVETLRLSPSAIRFVEWLWARAKKNEG